MKYRLIGLIALIAFGVISPVHAVDIVAGKRMSLFPCSECHGRNGISVVANFPNLAGQKALYLITQLKAFRAGKRKFPVMNLMTKQLSDADIHFGGVLRKPALQSPQRREAIDAGREVRSA